MKTPLILRYGIWSMLIFAVSMSLLSVRGLRSLELRTIVLGVDRRMASEVRQSPTVDVPAMIFPFYEQLSQERFLESVKDVTHKLKDAGAKVVIVPILDYLRPTARNQNSLQALLRDSIVVFGVSRRMGNFFVNDDPAPENRQEWWVHHPFFHRMNLPWGVIADYTTRFSMVRFIPTGMRDFDNGEAVPDIRVLALKRYFDIPDHAELPLSASRLHIGPYSFPIERDGLSYVPFRWSNRNWSEIYASFKPASDSIAYFAQNTNNPTDKASLDKAWRSFRGKIVLIDWFGAGGYRWPSYGWTSLEIFNAFFDRTFVTIHNEWNVLLITTLVVLLSVLSYVVRNGIMVFLSLLLAAGAVAISAWLFNAHNVLFEPVYCIVPILLCGSILPIVKISGEKRLAEERIRSLEEENRRLHDLQKPASHGSPF